MDVIYLFIQTYLYRVKIVLAIDNFALCALFYDIHYGNTYFNNSHMYDSYNN